MKHKLQISLFQNMELNKELLLLLERIWMVLRFEVLFRLLGLLIILLIHINGWSIIKCSLLLNLMIDFFGFILIYVVILFYIVYSQNYIFFSIFTFIIRQQKMLNKTINQFLIWCCPLSLILINLQSY